MTPLSQIATQSNSGVAGTNSDADSGNSSVTPTLLTQATRILAPSLPTSWINTHFSRIPDADFEALLETISSPSCSLTELNLQGAKTGDERATRLAAALQSNKTIVKLGLYNNQIGDAGAKALSHVLTTQRTLLDIDLRENNITSAGMQSLAQALEVNTTLEAISLDENYFTDAGIRSLAKALEANKGLQSLSMIGSQEKGTIGDQGAKDLSEALKVNKSLISIDLAYNDIGSAGASRIGEALRNNGTLKSLRLHQNRIDSKACQALLLGLAHNKTLVELDLGANPLGNVGFAYLGTFLSKNLSSLKSLDLICSFNVKNAGFGSLGIALKTNTGLKTLKLDYLNDVDSRSTLIEALKENKTLTSLSLQMLGSIEVDEKALRQMFAHNKSITTIKLGNGRAQNLELVQDAQRWAKQNRIPGIVALDLLTRFAQTGAASAAMVPANTVPPELLNVLSDLMDANGGLLV